LYSASWLEQPENPNIEMQTKDDKIRDFLNISQN
jgi:hypothetical protein